MIAIITSTIFTGSSTIHTLYRDSISAEERLTQTLMTIESLKSLGFSKIYLFDNSGFNWQKQSENQLVDMELVKFNSFQYNNKGLSELLMLIHGMEIIPDDIPILKISGRYSLTEKLDQNILNEVKFAGKFNSDTISTRAYYFCNKQVMQTTLFEALNNMYFYKHRVFGFRSLIQVIKNAFLKNNSTIFYDTNIAIERGMFNAIKKLELKTYKMQKINVRGISGHPADNKKVINE